MAKHALFWDYQYQSVAADSPGMRASHNLAVTHILTVSLTTRSFATGTPTEASLRETTRPTVTSSHSLSVSLVTNPWPGPGHASHIDIATV